MNSWISSPCDSAGEELNAGDQQPGLGAFDGFLEVFCEAAVAAEPGEGSFDDPAARQEFEAICGIGSLDDFEAPLADFGERGGEFFAGIGAVGEDMAQPREAVADRCQHIGSPVAVLDVGGMDDGGDQEALGVGEDMALPALDQLGGVEAARTAAFRGFHRLAVDHPGAWGGLAPRRFTYRHEKVMVDGAQRSIATPGVEISLDRAPRRELPGQHPPLATRAGHVQDRVQHLTQVRRARATQPLRRRQKRCDHIPFPVRQVTCVAKARALIVGASDFSPHVVSPRLLGHKRENHNTLESLNSFRAGH